MAEEDMPNRVEDDVELPLPAVPSRDPLPPPPIVNYTRPMIGQKTPAEPGQSSSGHGSLGDWSDASQAASHGAGLAAGATFVVSIIAGAMLGNWIDQRWNHTAMPWATLVMTLIGGAVGFINLQRLVARTNRDRKKK